MALAAERVFIGAGCNRIVNNVSWGPSGLVAFGAQNAVAVFSPQSAQILTTLPGHKAVVNCTEWLPSSKDAHKVQHAEVHYLLSGSSDGVLMVREMHLKKREWRSVLQVPEMHKKGVTCLNGLMVSPTKALFASSSSDGLIFIWELVSPSTMFGDCKISCLESLSVGSKPMVALSLAHLPGDTGKVILAMGGLDQKIHIYLGDCTGKFVHACELKGHTDWIRSLDFSLPLCIDGEKESLFLVSSSQDRSIRIWKMAMCVSSANSQVPYRKEGIGLTSYIEGPLFLAGSSSYQVSLESLLVGHEDWVYSVQWQPALFNGSKAYQPMSILSASMDKTMMIWKPEKNTGIWVNMVTVGELSHSALGFYGGHWAPDGKSILAHGYGGSFHLWRNTGVDCENWQPQNVPSGHFASVSDIAWSRNGEYILSVSHDQTTRIFAPWHSEASLGDRILWHEIARPQVHGHDINCVAIVRGGGNHRFVSGADEKVARVFEAPISFLKTLSHAAQKSSSFEDFYDDIQILGANMSALGLSQKPIYVHANSEAPSRLQGDASDSLETIPDAVPTVLTVPPVEEQLAWHTLWPESHKLYGHGNELFALCCDHEGKLVASACKAQSATVAEIWLWQVGSWKTVDRLQSHSLTVTQMEFSHDDSFLLSVSRDRHLSVFSINRSGEASHHLIAKREAHKRIIWACSWNPFGHEFATGSRDKTVKIWGIEGGSSVKQLCILPQFHDSVTALAWVGCDRSRNAGIIAVGMDDGLLELWNVSGGRVSAGDSHLSPFNAVLAIRFDPFLCHVSTVLRLSWKDLGAGDSMSIELASCGADQSVRVFKVCDI
ncbi:elongator complex protein 2 [Canna indica]|uniref:Elongator complex protein 2 n=1 Tax=Canna indica TaxID=4628 RepID=A0AAQ3QES5_9LILI|nr:elongator complex protein 2 [Canna indica]